MFKALRRAFAVDQIIAALGGIDRAEYDRMANSRESVHAKFIKACEEVVSLKRQIDFITLEHVKDRTAVATDRDDALAALARNNERMAKLNAELDNAQANEVKYIRSEIEAGEKVAALEAQIAELKTRPRLYAFECKYIRSGATVEEGHKSAPGRYALYAHYIYETGGETSVEIRSLAKSKQSQQTLTELAEKLNSALGASFGR